MTQFNHPQDGPKTVREPVAAQVTSLSFGCRLNSVESEAMQSMAEQAGHERLVIVNTCAVTSESVRQARQAIRRLAREQPDLSIAVTGCAAEIDPQSFAALPGVTKIIGNAVKQDASIWSVASPQRTASIAAPSQAMSGQRKEGRTRAFLAVQNGCDHRCTFCVIPYGRGDSRSTPLESVVEQAQVLTAQGYKEIVLTGVDLTSWGADLPQAQPLGQLVRAILRGVPDLPRLRLSSIDCIEADEVLLRAFAEEERLAPYLHLSLQAGDDLVLKRMKRRHSRQWSVDFCAKLRHLRPDVAFGADLIAGFPTETESQFQNSLALIEDCGLSYLHVFPYSPRPMTPAARMPQTPGAVIKERAARLRVAGAQAMERHLQTRVGRRLQVLTEKGGVARAADFTLVLTPGQTAGRLLNVVITGATSEALLCDIEADQNVSAA